MKSDCATALLSMAAAVLEIVVANSHPLAPRTWIFKFTYVGFE
jgi:hypothetical protein